MLTRLLAAASAAVLFSCAAAQAQSLCNPVRGSVFQVTGVASNDTLNLRAAPGADNQIVGLAGAKERNIRFENEVAYTSKGCRNACAAAATGLKAAQLAVEVECTAKARLWYKVRLADGRRGWAAAKFLKLAAATATPAPAPEPQRPSPDSYSFVCERGGRVLLLTREKTRDAVFIDSRGTEHMLVRERGSQYPLSYRGRDDDGSVEMYVRGDRREVEYSDLRGRVDYCVGVRN